MPRVHRSISRALALTLLVGHLLAVAMAWSPALHHWAHGDADATDHACAVAGVLGGQLDQPDSPLDLPAPHLFAAESSALPLARPFLTGGSRNCAQDRAPPRA